MSDVDGLNKSKFDPWARMRAANDALLTSVLPELAGLNIKPGASNTVNQETMNHILELPAVKQNTRQFIEEIMMKDNSGIDFNFTADGLGQLAFEMGRLNSEHPTMALTFDDLRTKLAGKESSDGTPPKNPLLYERMTDAYKLGRDGNVAPKQEPAHVSVGR